MVNDILEERVFLQKYFAAIVTNIMTMLVMYGDIFFFSVWCVLLQIKTGKAIYCERYI